MTDSNSETINPRPWYKEPWLWLILGLPLGTVIAGLTLVFIATIKADALVADDYYKEGLAINRIKDKQQQAAQWKISAELSQEEGWVTMLLKGEAAQLKDAVKVGFYHATISAKDFSSPALSVDQQGRARFRVSDQLLGKWRVKIAPTSEQWLLQGDWSMSDTKIVIN